MYSVVVYTLTKDGRYELIDTLVDAAWLAACAFMEEHASAHEIVSINVTQSRVREVC